MGLIRKPSEIEAKQTISMLIYGQPGSGKSSLGVSAPLPVLFDYDGGVGRINGAHQVPTVQIHSWEDTQAALEEINAEMPQTQTIIIDTVGKMLDYMSDYIIRTNPKMRRNDGNLSLQGYGMRKNMFVDFLRRIAISGRNVVFIAHEKEEKRGEEFVKRPEVGGSSANDLIKDLDLVGYMQFIGNERTIAFTPTEFYYAKNTCNLAPVLKLPITVGPDGNAIGNNNFLTEIINTYGRVQAEKQQMAGEYDMLISVIDERVGACETVDDLNKLTAEFGDKSFKHIYNSRLIAGQALNKRAAELGCVYSKVDQKYVLSK